MHRPYWRYALETGRTDALHELFRKRRVDYVFTGHDHFYCTTTRDSIRFFQVGPSGSRIKVHDDPAQGAFQNYLFVRVNGDSVEVSVREAGKYEPMPADIVTWESVRAIADIKERALGLSSVTVPQGRSIAGECEVVIENVTGSDLAGKLVWRGVGASWGAAPEEIAYSIAAGGRVSQKVKLSLGNSDSLYPLPSCSLHYPYADGRAVELKRALPVRREGAFLKAARRPVIDGRLNDGLWQAAAPVRSLGDKEGGRSPVEPVEAWVGSDDSLVYIAALCRESKPDRVKADAVERDGRVTDDDHLNIVLDLDRQPGGTDSGQYYQLFVNAAGTVSDRRCWFESGKSRKDYSWDGNWRVAAARGDNWWSVELSCPLADFGRIGPSLGFNLVRFQSRFKDIGVWQVPFEHDPATFGRLHR
jgi:hypothetical protein